MQNQCQTPIARGLSSDNPHALVLLAFSDVPGLRLDHALRQLALVRPGWRSALTACGKRNPRMSAPPAGFAPSAPHGRLTHGQPGQQKSR